MSTQPRNDGTERYRRVLDGFGSGSIQGTEDWPIDPTVEDAKTIGIAITLALAFLSAPGPWPVLATGAALSLAGGFLVVYLAPSDRAPYRWIYSILQFKLGTKRFTKHSEDSTEQTQTLTGIDRVLPGFGAVKRRDGTLVAMVEVEGRDMALAEAEAWEDAASGFENLADSIDAGFEVYSPARTIDPGRLAGKYIGRQFDSDVKRNDALAGLVEDYQNELPAEFRSRGTAVRQFYVVVSVTEAEVRREDHGILAQLADLPVVGGPVRWVGLARRGPTDAEIEVRQRSILSARKRAVRNAIASIEGCSTSGVDGEHLTGVIKEYWTGIRTSKSGRPVPKYTLPVVTRGGIESENDADETGGY
jgi:hypothetical protein